MIRVLQGLKLSHVAGNGVPNLHVVTNSRYTGSTATVTPKLTTAFFPSFNWRIRDRKLKR